ncbi:MAG: DNA polymerase V family protein [Acidimicrobiia bacterium]|nr:DNA polymerase V family protein [Acidimicrobiia bacterium]MDH4306627.1 DNA polymerase V family protein [Acidimicrobiia bacterium]MDH5292063.1 DNA polymerase V family protein [Acidimicrobiia bacterium]
MKKLILVASLVLAACGSGDAASDVTVVPPTDTTVHDGEMMDECESKSDDSDEAMTDDSMSGEMTDDSISDEAMLEGSKANCDEEMSDDEMSDGAGESDQG